MTEASREINLQKQQSHLSGMAKVKAARSAHSMANVIPFFNVFNIPFESNAFDKTKKIYFSHTIKKTISVTFSVCQHFNSFFQTRLFLVRWLFPTDGAILAHSNTFFKLNSSIQPKENIFYTQ